MTRTKARKLTDPKTDRRLVVVTPTPAGEDVSVFECDVLSPYYAGQIGRGELRLFDAARDDRGPEVPFVATWDNKPSSWHPQTDGVYIVQFRADTPAEVRRSCGLGMGDCSSPQHRRSHIAAVYRDIIERRPELSQWLEVLKVPCVFRADATDFPGGSCVVIDPATLPEPAAISQISRTYM